MIFGRPTNLWNGLVVALSGALSATAIVLGAPAQQVGILAGVWTAVVGAVITIVAGQPPTLNPGDAYTVVTPNDAPNVTKVANTNMAAQPPVQVAP